MNRRKFLKGVVATAIDTTLEGKMDDIEAGNDDSFLEGLNQYYIYSGCGPKRCGELFHTPIIYAENEIDAFSKWKSYYTTQREELGFKDYSTLKEKLLDTINSRVSDEILEKRKVMPYYLDDTFNPDKLYSRYLNSLDSKFRTLPTIREVKFEKKEKIIIT